MKCAKSSWNVLKVQKICQILRKCAESSESVPNLRKYEKVCQNLRNYEKVFQNLRKLEKVWECVLIVIAYANCYLFAVQMLFFLMRSKKVCCYFLGGVGGCVCKSLS